MDAAETTPMTLPEGAEVKAVLYETEDGDLRIASCDPRFDDLADDPVGDDVDDAPGAVVESALCFRAFREHLGMTEYDVARACGLRSALEVKRWEDPKGPGAPDGAWDVIWDLEDTVEAMRHGLCQGVLDVLDALSEEGEELPPGVPIAQYASQEQFDRRQPGNRGRVPYRVANRGLVEAAIELMDSGVSVAFLDADDDACPVGSKRLFEPEEEPERDGWRVV